MLPCCWPVWCRLWVRPSPLAPTHSCACARAEGTQLGIYEPPTPGASAFPSGLQPVPGDFQRFLGAAPHRGTCVALPNSAPQAPLRVKKGVHPPSLS